MDAHVAELLAAETEAREEYYRLQKISDRYYRNKKRLLLLLVTAMLLSVLAWQTGPIGATTAIVLTITLGCVTLGYIVQKPENIDGKLRIAKAKHDQYLLSTHHYMERQMHNLPVY